MVEDHRGRIHAQETGEAALEADRHVAQPDRPVAGVEQARVTMPTGLVKSMIHAPGLARLRIRSATSSTTGTVRSALPSPPAPVVSWPTQPHAERKRLVADPRLLPADPQLDHRGVGVGDAGVQVGRPGHLAGMAVMAEDPGRERADDLQPVGGRVDQHEFGDHRAEPGEAVDQFRRIGGSAADNCDFHPLNPVKRNALHECALGEEEDDDQRSHRQHRCRRDQVPVDVMDTVERREPERQRPRLFVLAGVEQRPVIVVPAVEELEQPGRRDTRPGHRQRPP